MKLFLVFTGMFLCLQAIAQEQGDSDSAIYYIIKGQPAVALPFAKRSFEAVKNTGNDTAYLAVTKWLGDIYTELIQLDSARVYSEKAMAKAKKIYGENSAQHGNFIVRVARVYTELGQHQKAEQLLQRATTILGETEGSSYNEDDGYYDGDGGYYKGFHTYYLIHYAYFYIRTSNLNKAEELSLRACEMALSEPVDKFAYILALSNLPLLYDKMGFYEKLDSTALHRSETIKEVYGEKHYMYSTGIFGLADIYQRRQNLEKADSMFRKALEIRRQTISKNSAANIPVLTRLGIVNMEMGKFEVAEKYLEEAAEIIHENGGEEFTYYAYCMKNLARLYVLTGRKEQAAPIFQKCLRIYNKLDMELHSDRLKVLHDMAGLLYADNPAKAAVYLQEAMSTENKLLLEKLDFLSETELLAYLKANKDIADNPYRFLLRHNSSQIVRAAYNSRLLAGSIGLQNTRVLYQNMAQSKDSELGRLWQNYLQQKAFYTNLLLTPVTQRQINTDSVAAILNIQEKEILRRSADYRKMKEQLSITWQDVQKHLQPGETAVEFVRFNGASNILTSSKTDTFYYAALLLRPQDEEPQFVLLCEEKQLITAMKKFPYKAAVNTRGKKAAAYDQNATNALYQLVWQPLEPYLINNTKTIYFSPAGLLHRIAFAAIPDKKNHKLLCDKFDLVQLTSTRQVALQETRIPAPVSIVMFGGINYNHSADTGVQVSADLYAWVYRENRSADLDSFSYLPHTLKEINTIKTNTENLQKSAVVFKADNATEAAFRNLGGDNSPEVIHFATHGFTLPDTSTGRGNAGTPFKASDNPLLRCGLVMAGGNKGWKGEAGLDEDDGILTGLEISTVQLPHTQLAVLSACETGLGKIEGSEGVFGLQRAFKLAGVNYVMASLWQVPDKETAEFMETFYTHWLNGKTIRGAFLHTQQAMRKKYAPYYWAGFTLVQ